MEIPCLTCLIWPHFIQNKLEITIYLSWDKCKKSYCNSMFYIGFITFCILNLHVVWKSVDPDQLQCGSWSAGFWRSQLIWIYTEFIWVYIWFHYTVFKKKFTFGISTVRAKRSCLCIICPLGQVKCSLNKYIMGGKFTFAISTPLLQFTQILLRVITSYMNGRF